MLFIHVLAVALAETEGVDVNERDATTGGWPLLAAAQRQDLAVAQLLVDYGARCCSHDHAATTTELHALAEAEKGPFPRQVPSTVATSDRVDPQPCSPFYALTLVQAGTTAARLMGGIRSWLAPSASVKLWQLLLENGASATAYPPPRLAPTLGQSL
jgi:hypothetical protein